jgi:hypothetical protein
MRNLQRWKSATAISVIMAAIAEHAQQTVVLAQSQATAMAAVTADTATDVTIFRGPVEMFRVGTATSACSSRTCRKSERGSRGLSSKTLAPPSFSSPRAYLYLETTTSPWALKGVVGSELRRVTPVDVTAYSKNSPVQ